MYKKGDVLKVSSPEAIGGFEYLMFTEDAHMVHQNPLKYMGAAMAVCDDYLREGARQKILCQSCRHQCPARKYMVKYVGAFSGESGTGRVGTTTAITYNSELTELLKKEKGQKRADEGMELVREQELLRHQASVSIRSPFVMQTMMYGQSECGEVSIDYVVLEYVKGRELRNHIAILQNMQDQNEADRRRFDIIRQMFLAVRAYARQYSAVYNVHRDLKPENMLVYTYGDDDSYQQLKLLDFDMMVTQGKVAEHDLYLGGTEGYVHPEAYKLKNLPDDPDRQFSHGWDLYAVGLMMYEIMEGHPHFNSPAYLENADEAYLLKPMKSARMYPELTNIIKRLISNDSSQYRDIDEVIEDYQKFLTKYYGGDCYLNFYMDHFLEGRPGLKDRPGYESKLPFVNIYCLIQSNGLKACRQSFCVYENTVTKLIYGKNIIGSKCTKEKVLQTEIGAFYYIGGDVRFIPLSRDCQSSMKDSVDRDETIHYMDVEIQIEGIDEYK